MRCVMRRGEIWREASAYGCGGLRARAVTDGFNGARAFGQALGRPRTRRSDDPSGPWDAAAAYRSPEVARSPPLAPASWPPAHLADKEGNLGGAPCYFKTH